MKTTLCAILAFTLLPLLAMEHPGSLNPNLAKPQKKKQPKYGDPIGYVVTSPTTPNTKKTN